MNNTNNIAAEFLAPTKNHTGDCTEEERAVKVGAPGTVQIGSDCYGVTIMAVYKRFVLVRRDRAIRTDNNGLDERQEYRFAAGSNDRAEWERFNLCDDGSWRRGRSYYLRVGVRRACSDPCF